MMVTSQYCLSAPKFAMSFFMMDTILISLKVSVSMDGQKNASQSNTTSSEFLQPLMSCFRQYMGG